MRVNKRSAAHILIFTLAALTCVSLTVHASSRLQRSDAAAVEQGPQEARQRVIILSDIEADPDDTESFVRLFLYANEIDIKGLVAITSVHQKHRVAPESIKAIVDAYAKVKPHLDLHEKGYPSAAALASLITVGQPDYGMAAVGDGKDTPGSERIIRVLDENDDRPLWISVWGGANTLAQALHTLKSTRTPEALARLVAKLRVYSISDQDDSGIWIRTHFPALFYVVSPGGYGAATWTGMNLVVDGIDNTEISNKWLADNIQQGHGPLGAAYPDVAYGMEGDTPAFLSLIPNGLNAPEHPDWGGWGGRYELYIPKLADMDPDGFNGGVPIHPEPRAIWTNATDTYTPWLPNEFGRAGHLSGHSFTGYQTTIWRWRDDVQNDFAARMAWTTETSAAANHPPVAMLTTPERLTVKSGEQIVLSALGSHDPDGDSLSYYWFQYPEAGTYRAVIPMGTPNLISTWFTAPKVKRVETVHIILRVTDKGTPPLSRYRRVIVTIRPD